MNDIRMQEIIQRRHMRLLPEENIVRQILYDLRDDHQPLPDRLRVLLRQLHVDHRGADDRRRDEPQEDERAERRELWNLPFNRTCRIFISNEEPDVPWLVYLERDGSRRNSQLCLKRRRTGS